MKRIFAQSALAVLLTAAGAIDVTMAANAQPHYQSGPYHKDRLPNGQLTGPIGPQVNGG